MRTIKEKKVSDRMIGKLASRMYHADRRRNITAIAAIALSSMLVILVLSTILSFEELMRRSQQMMIGTQAEGVYLNTSISEFEQLKENGYFDEISFVADMGYYETASSSGGDNRILYTDEVTAAWNFNDLLEGRWPVQDGEIVVDERFIDDHGGNVRVGDHMPILFKAEAGESRQDAVICGICHSNDMLDEARIYVSEPFFQENREKNGGILQAYCRFESGRYTEDDLKNFMWEISPDVECFAFVNRAAGNQIRVGALGFMCGLITLAVICAGLMIYTIYYISMVKNVIQYGQLKLIGVTGRQIRIIIRKHALRQYLTGLPIGCFLGAAFGYALMPFISSYAGIGGENAVTLRPAYFICAAVLDYIVVYIGVHKPMRILAKTPPVHAIGFTDSRREKAGRVRNERFTPGRFALRNIRRRSKNTQLVAFSMSIVILLFVTTMNIVHSLDLESLLSILNLFADIEIASEDFLYGVEVGEAGDIVKIPDTLREELEKMPEKVDTVYHYNRSMPVFLYGEDADKYCQVVLDEDSYQKNLEEDGFLYDVMVGRAEAYREKKNFILMQENYRFYDYGDLASFEIFEGSLDREKFESGEYVLAVALDGEGNSYHHAGDVVELYDEFPQEEEYVYECDENGRYPYFDALRTREYKVLAVVSDEYRNQMAWGDTHTVGMEYIFPTKCMEHMERRPDLFMVTMNAPDAETLAVAEAYVEDCLERTGGEEAVSYRSRRTYKEILNQLGRMVSLFGNGLAVLVGVMALVNFLNSSVSGIAERKEEFSTLQAIGMMRRLLIKVLRLENLYTVLLAVIPGYLLGQVVSMAVISKVSVSIPYLKCNVTLLPGILLAGIIVMLSMLYPNRRTDIGNCRRRR